MADPAPKATKAAVVEAFLLACNHSRVGEFITAEALRTVLELEFVDLVATGAFDLQAVWELLEEQPGFDAAFVGPPMCMFKSWEDKLLPIELPIALRGLTAADRADLAANCPVAPAKLARVLSDIHDAEKIATRDAERRAAAREAALTGVAVPLGGRRRGRFGAWTDRHRATIMAFAVVLGVGGFGIAGVTAFRGCRPAGDWDNIPADFAGDLPVADARQLGSQVGARLTDPSWLDLPRERRERDLVAALDRLKGQDITVFFVTDDSGVVRASAQRQIRPPGVEVRFR